MTGTGRLFLIGQTSHLAEGWRTTVERFDLAWDTAVGAADPLREAGTNAAAELDVPVSWEHPADVIPLPDGHAARTRTTGIPTPEGLELRHFDPYSVVFRVVARGDEPDYRTALGYLAGGWVTMEKLEVMLERTLSRFTQDTIQQDPAEFRRKFHGLLQMWRSQAAKRLGG
jgi:hypothetical protein